MSKEITKEENEKAAIKRTEYNMNLNDTISFSSGITNMVVMRVPGGWIYTTILDAGIEGEKYPPIASSVFVPLSKPEVFELIPDAPIPRGSISV